MKYNNFGFEREKITIHLEEGFESYEDEIEFLHWLLHEYRTNPPELDPNMRNPITFEEYVRQQIEYREKKIERLKDGNKSDTELFMIKGDRRNVVRIFESMKNAGIIDAQTKPKYLVSMFFTDKEEIRKQAQYYSNTKKELEELGSQTNDEALKIFIKNLVATSFSSKKEVIRELRDYLAELQKP